MTDLTDQSLIDTNVNDILFLHKKLPDIFYDFIPFYSYLIKRSPC